MSLATQIRQVSTPQELEAALKTKKQLIALVYSVWCPFCQDLLPVFKRYAQDREDCLLIRDDTELIAEHYGIEVIPTLLYFEEGVLKRRLDGALGRGLGEQELVDFLSSVNRL
ncbi:MAG: thioredoxin family protein [Firmicutes bacterium]|nr:thioredoxin family protein [Bacillota bacterium]